MSRAESNPSPPREPSGARVEPGGFSEDAFCPQCGYNLRGLHSERCPECGEAIDRAALIVSAIPWVHRINRGVLRAYWQTVWAVAFHPVRFSWEMARPVHYADAQRFRWMTIAHVCFPVLLLAEIAGGFAFWQGFSSAGVQAFIATIWLPVIFLLGLLAAVIVATGLHTYFFHPRRLPIEQQNRAVALSYYACGPLAGFGLPAVLAFAGFLLSEFGTLVAFGGGEFTDLSLPLIVLAGILLAALLLSYWISLTTLFERTTHPEELARWLFRYGFPVLWLVTVGLTFLGTALVGSYVAIVFASLL